MRDYREPEPEDPSIVLPMEVYQELVATRDRWRDRVRQMEAEREVAEDFHTRMRLLHEARAAARLLFTNWRYMVDRVDEGLKHIMDCEGLLRDAEEIAERCPWIKGPPR